MKFQFPAIKTTRSIDEQFQKILDECNEYQETSSKEEKDKESIDILHSVETFLRLRFKDRENELDKLVQDTILKNTKRGYYENDCY